MRVILADYDWPSKVYDQLLLSHEPLDEATLATFAADPDQPVLRALLDTEVAGQGKTKHWEIVAVVNALLFAKGGKFTDEDGTIRIYPFVGEETVRHPGERSITNWVVQFHLCCADHDQHFCDFNLREQVELLSERTAEHWKELLRQFLESTLRKRVQDLEDGAATDESQAKNKRNWGAFFQQLLDHVHTN